VNIRKATYRDAPAIKVLIETIGYSTTISLLINQLEILFSGNDHQVFVYEQHREVAGFISIHFLPQLAFENELVMITCLAVDESARDHRIDKALEDYVAKLSLNRKCDRILVLCHQWRKADHKFYEQQGYEECPKYYSKKLVYAKS
jgi:N-acetylglutamate synthase-like GNAT family acetyltransferase